MAVLDVAYHGTTTSLIDLSPYKHDGAGGSGPAPWVHVATMPDTYRGPHRGDDAGAAYGEEVRATLSKAKDGAAAFIAESALGCGGQIILPEGFLASAYAHARAAGALCIADEVQTGMGRAGSHFWMFETQNVVPDIVALKTGNQFKSALQDMATRHELIGDVRGQGLFLGAELVRDHKTLEPADAEATKIVNEMRARGILLSTDGPLHNVLKIKPPIIFPENEVSRVIQELEDVLKRL